MAALNIPEGMGYDSIVFKSNIGQIFLSKRKTISKNKTDSYFHIKYVAKHQSKTIEEDVKSIIDSFISNPFYSENMKIVYTIYSAPASLKPELPMDTYKLSVYIDFKSI